MSDKTNRKSYIKAMVTVSICVALISVSAWITIPFLVDFTMQTFAILLISALFNWKISCLSVLLYIMIGLCGIPVFSAFGSGPAVLFGPTGGYIIGFIIIPVIVNIILHFVRPSKIITAIAMLIGLLFCYTVGTLWYCLVWGTEHSTNVFTVLCICVFPFIIPDLIKIILAIFVASRLSPIIKKL